MEITAIGHQPMVKMEVTIIPTVGEIAQVTGAQLVSVVRMH
jgi:hypothetical protein